MFKRIVVLFFLVLVFPRVVLAEPYEIKKGETVSQIVLKLTGSANYLRDGIKVVTDKGVEISGAKSRAKFDHVHPRWMVVVDDKLAKTVQVKDSAKKTLAQVCSESLAGPRCEQKLAKLNGISKRQVSKPLADNVYALCGMLKSDDAANASAPCKVTAPAFAPVVAIPVPLDLCPNIEGVQESVPAGKVVNSYGSCTDPPPPPSPPPPPPPPTLSKLWLIPLGIFALGFIAWRLYIRRKEKLDITEQERVRACAQESEEYSAKVEALFEAGLNKSSNAVKFTRSIDPTGRRGVLGIIPTIGNYPDTRAHQVNLNGDLKKIRAKLIKEPYEIGQPYTDAKGVVCVPFSYTGGVI